MLRFKEILDRIVEMVCIFLFAIMVIVGVYQIVTRYFFNAPSTVSEELLTFLFTWLALLSAALVFGKREHMRMSFLADKAKPRTRLVLEIIAICVTLIFAILVMIYGGIYITKLTMTQVTASLGIPMGIVYSVVPISGVLTIVYSIMNFISLFNGEEEQA